MGTSHPSKKRESHWKKAILQFTLCFSLGLFSGFAPTNSPLFLSHRPSDRPDPPDPTFNQTFLPDPKPTAMKSSKPLILVTVARSGDPFRAAMLGRLSRTVQLVPPPVLWIVVGPRAEAETIAETLRTTGVVYRQLMFDESFAEAEAEMEFQRNLGLSHVEHHRLDGIIHFMELGNVYDLDFFNEIRRIDVFGTWLVASVSVNRKRVIIEGPICESSRVTGWHLNDSGSAEETGEIAKTGIGISSFAFNSSILWDPERWGRTSITPHYSQDSMKFVRELIMEDETKLLAFPSDCYRVFLWQLHLPRSLLLVSSMVSTDPNTNEPYI